MVEKYMRNAETSLMEDKKMESSEDASIGGEGGATSSVPIAGTWTRNITVGGNRTARAISGVFRYRELEFVGAVVKVQVFSNSLRQRTESTTARRAGRTSRTVRILQFNTDLGR